ncbi:hypothetical protein HPB52_013059 [Rhipicephalus sanguineus]|uniref:DUF885 domain-containing protein n=1 Tax=Rhipicephalus sanguineus TaxID=34632 RepID=A0A9D4T9Z4_RHISA|nr:hypothetical protein HPB52_013059 [Rhipicephalus sanguineus]
MIRTTRSQQELALDDQRRTAALQNLSHDITSSRMLAAFLAMQAFVGYYSSNPEAMATELFEEFWQWRLKDSPEFATMVGFHGYDHLLESYSIKSFQDRKVIKSLGSDASPKEFSEMIRNDSSFLCKSSEEVVRMYEQLLDEEINPKLLTIFSSVPKSPLRIQLQDASKSGGPCAMYIQGTTDFSRPGIFYVNAADLTRSPKYLMAALALHEGNPGHHLQGSYAMELPGMPSFRSQIEDRRYNDGPVHFPLHTAYVEGWGLYSEYLGYELGVYRTLHDKFGHLSQEMLRACRLVVDTGMHALGWSRERAVQYLLEHTSSSQAEVESEIDRYITWPGQASIKNH